MQKIAFILLLIGASLTSMLTSCKNNSPAACSNNFNFYAELSDEANNLAAAAMAFGQDPTTANCNAYKDAFNNYLDAARDLEDCAQRAGQGADYIQAIDEAQEALDMLQC